MSATTPRLRTAREVRRYKWTCALGMTAFWLLVGVLGYLWDPAFGIAWLILGGVPLLTGLLLGFRKLDEMPVADAMPSVEKIAESEQAMRSDLLRVLVWVRHGILVMVPSVVLGAALVPGRTMLILAAAVVVLGVLLFRSTTQMEAKLRQAEDGQGT